MHTYSKLQFKFAIFIFVEHHTICFKAYNSSFIHGLLHKLTDDLKGEMDIPEVLRFVYSKRTGTQVIDDEIQNLGLNTVANFKHVEGLLKLKNRKPVAVCIKCDR